MENKTDKKLLILTSIAIILSLIAIIIYSFGINPEFLMPIRNALSPLIYAFALAYLLDKFIVFLTEKTFLSRTQSIVIAAVLIVFIILFLLAIGIPTLIDNTLSLVETLSNNSSFEVPAKYIEDKFNSEVLIEINKYIKDSFESMISRIGQLSGELLKSVVTQAFAITSTMIKMILSFVIAIYMLIDKKDLLIRIKRFLFAFVDYKKTMNILRIGEIADNIFSSFFIGKLIDSTIIGVLCYFISNIVNIPNPLIISIIIGITNIIPYVGPFIGSVPAIIITLLVMPSKTIPIILIILALQQFDGLVLGPLILGDKMKVSPFWIIIAVTIGGALNGFIGMFLGVPVLVLIKTVIEEIVSDKLKNKSLEKIDELKIDSRKDVSDMSFRKIINKLKNKQ